MAATAKRHRWAKLRIHVYICRECGMGKVNAEERGWWKTTWFKPDGTKTVDTRVPPCAVGSHTLAYLGKYKEQLAASGPLTADEIEWGV